MNVIEYLQNYYDKSTLEKGYIGKTEQGKPIPFFLVKKSAYPIVIVQCAIHAREYITTYLCLKLIDDFVKNGKNGSVYFIPMVNIDGVEICLTKDKLYKANANGVDLNVNFEARWGLGAQNVFTKGAKNYVGKSPFSESETKALRDFTLIVNPNLTISYHSKGEEIYWEFFQPKENLQRDFKIAKKASEITGYPLKRTPNSSGGYKDWCIEKLLIPAYLT